MLQLCPVTASLLLGTARAACDEELLAREGVTFCVNVTRLQPFPALRAVRGIRVPVFDDPAEDLARYFEPCGAAIEEAVRAGGRCLVYCKNGRSRSAAICTAYLMRHRQLPLKDAFEGKHTTLRNKIESWKFFNSVRDTDGEKANGNKAQKTIKHRELQCSLGQLHSVPPSLLTPCPERRNKTPCLDLMNKCQDH
ncbi:dual specificity phosphatase 28 isoform X1 [Agelaius phoeniceus]|uniref:dual specificity phosphatase 28 isoform X1 n=1 Tax=Agelaius phoeniceus TaxID=39638 RepID=UPI004055324B